MIPAMDVERTIQFLLESQAAQDARFSRQIEDINATLDKVSQRQDRNERLTYQLITLMSQQQSQAGKRLLQTDERFRKTDERINKLAKKIDAFLSGLGKNGKNGHKKNS
jgi:uncharacterized protein YdcH (DUF465 family)